MEKMKHKNLEIFYIYVLFEKESQIHDMFVLKSFTEYVIDDYIEKLILSLILENR